MLAAPFKPNTTLFGRKRGRMSSVLGPWLLICHGLHCILGPALYSGSHEVLPQRLASLLAATKVCKRQMSVQVLDAVMV